MVGMSGKANEPRGGTTGSSKKQQLVPGGHNKAQVSTQPMTTSSFTGVVHVFWDKYGYPTQLTRCMLMLLKLLCLIRRFVQILNQSLFSQVSHFEGGVQGETGENIW